MKARKRGTDNPFEEIDCLQFKNSYVLYKADMIEFENESKGNKLDNEHWQMDDITDWNYYRIHAAIAAMQGLLIDPNKVGFAKNYAEVAVEYADALIEQLKKK